MEVEAEPVPQGDVGKMIGQKKKLVSEIKEFRAAYSEEKKQRDEQNIKVSEFKAKRDEANKKINDAREQLNKLGDEISVLRQEAPKNYRVLQKEYEELDWRYQTEVFSVNREKEIVKRMQALEKELVKANELRDKERERRELMNKLLDVKAEANVYHGMLMKHAKESEEHHQNMIKQYESISKLSGKIDTLNTEITSVKAVEQEEKKQMVFEAKPSAAGKREIEDKAQQIMEDFKKGKKITLDELAILEQAGI